VKVKEFGETVFSLKVQMPPNESCPFEEDITIYSLPFQVSLLDYLVRDEFCNESPTKFQILFASLEFQISKQVIHEDSPFALI